MEATFKGNPVRLSGELPAKGTKAPAFTLTGQNLNDISLEDLRGKRVVLNIFPSLDTDVCAASVRRFNKEASELDNTVVLCVSEDLPFAAARFCTVNGIENVSTASRIPFRLRQRLRSCHRRVSSARTLHTRFGSNRRKRRHRRNLSLQGNHGRTRL